MDVSGKVAVITGASSGIGLAIAKILASKGAKVALVARSKDKLDQLAGELNGAFAVKADVSKQEVLEMVKAVLEHYGRIDVLVNNAGQGYDAPVEKVNPCAFGYLFDLDVMGPLLAMKEVIPVMRLQGGGAIVNVSSGTALMQLEGMGLYSALKAALAQISKTAAVELKSDNISVSVVYPYITLTDFEKNTLKDASVAQQEDTIEGQAAWAKADSAEFAAGLMLKAIEGGAVEVFAHYWMKPKVGR